ncbi:MAG: hypothetical protein F9K40_06675 [Kofleriaceae bacterium]|nr:MAG: hypothetical protein F9K40_06675 [Kofleriaceae bacterium]
MRRRLAGSAALLAAAALAGGGCTDTTIDGEPVPALDLAFYAASVQRYVGYGCGSLDCHGEAGRMLRIYAEDGLRQSAELRGEVIEASEIAANVASFAAIELDASSAADSLTLRKPLAVTAGGMAHEGGDVWLAVEEDGYRCLRGWLAGELTVEVAAACHAATTEVVPPP